MKNSCDADTSRFEIFTRSQKIAKTKAIHIKLRIKSGLYVIVIFDLVFD